MDEDNKSFQIGNVVKFKEYRHQDEYTVGEIVATRKDKPDMYLVVFRTPREAWVKAEDLTVETIDTLKKYEEGKL